MHSAGIPHMKTFFLVTLCAALLSFGDAAYAQVDQSEPQVLIKTATQQILDEVRTQAIAPDDIPRIMDIVNRDIVPYTDFRRTTSLAMSRAWRRGSTSTRSTPSAFVSTRPTWVRRQSRAGRSYAISSRKRQPPFRGTS